MPSSKPINMIGHLKVDLRSEGTSYDTVIQLMQVSADNLGPTIKAGIDYFDSKLNESDQEEFEKFRQLLTLQAHYTGAAKAFKYVKSITEEMQRMKDLTKQYQENLKNANKMNHDLLMQKKRVQNERDAEADKRKEARRKVKRFQELLKELTEEHDMIPPELAAEYDDILGFLN